VTFRQSKAFAPCLRLAPPAMEKAAEQSAQADATRFQRELGPRRWYGDPVQERKAAGRH